MMVFLVQTNVYRCWLEEKTKRGGGGGVGSLWQVKILFKEAHPNHKDGKCFFLLTVPIQRKMTRSFSESCTYIKDAPDSPPAVAMEVAEM